MGSALRLPPISTNPNPSARPAIGRRVVVFDTPTTAEAQRELAKVGPVEDVRPWGVRVHQCPHPGCGVKSLGDHLFVKLPADPSKVSEKWIEANARCMKHSGGGMKVGPARARVVAAKSEADKQARARAEASKRTDAAAAKRGEADIENMLRRMRR